MLYRLARTRLLGQLTVVEKARTLCLRPPLTKRTCDRHPMLKRYTVWDQGMAIPTRFIRPTKGCQFYEGNCDKLDSCTTQVTRSYEPKCTDRRDCRRAKASTSRNGGRLRSARCRSTLTSQQKPDPCQGSNPIFDTVRFINSNARPEDCRRQETIGDCTQKDRSGVPQTRTDPELHRIQQDNPQTHAPHQEVRCDCNKTCTNGPCPQTEGYYQSEKCSTSSCSQNCSGAYQQQPDYGLPGNRRFIRVKVNMKNKEDKYPVQCRSCNCGKGTRIWKALPILNPLKKRRNVNPERLYTDNVSLPSPPPVETESCEQETMNCDRKYAVSEAVVAEGRKHEKSHAIYPKTVVHEVNKQTAIEDKFAEKRWDVPPNVLQERTEKTLPRVGLFPEQRSDFLPDTFQEESQKVAVAEGFSSDRCVTLPMPLPNELERSFVNFSSSSAKRQCADNGQGSKCPSQQYPQPPAKNGPPSPMMSGSYDECNSCCNCNRGEPKQAPVEPAKEERVQFEQQVQQEQPSFHQAQQTQSNYQQAQEAQASYQQAQEAQPSYQQAQEVQASYQQAQPAQQSYQQTQPVQQSYTQAQEVQSCCAQECSPKEACCCQRSKFVLALEKRRCELERAAQKAQCELDYLERSLKYQRDKAIAALGYKKEKTIQDAQCNIKAVEDNIKYQKEKATSAIANTVQIAKVNMDNLEENIKYKKGLLASNLKYHTDKAVQNTKCNLDALEQSIKHQKALATNSLAHAVETTKYHVNEVGKSVKYQKDRAAINLDNIITNAKCQINHIEDNIKHKKEMVANHIKYHTDKAIQNTKCTVNNLEQNLKHKTDVVASNIKYHKEKTLQEAKCKLDEIEQNVKYQKDRTTTAVNNLKSDVKDIKCRMNQAVQSTIANANYRVKSEVVDQAYRMQYRFNKLTWLIKWHLTTAKYHRDRIAVSVHNMSEKVKKEVGELVDYIQKCMKKK